MSSDDSSESSSSSVSSSVSSSPSESSSKRSRPAPKAVSSVRRVALPTQELELDEDDEVVLIKLPPGFDLKQLHKLEVSLPKAKEQVTMAVAKGDAALLRPLDGSYLDNVRLLACDEEGTFEPQMLDRGLEVVQMKEEVSAKTRKQIVAEAKRQVAPPKRVRPPPMDLARKLPIGFVEQAEKPKASKKSKVDADGDKKKKKKKKKDKK